MKKTTKKTPARPRSKNENRLSRVSEKAIDAKSLDQEVPEEDREIIPNELVDETVNTANWSEAEDRGEDLANMKDPFIQAPEQATEVPPELTQKRIGETLQFDENLADRFDAERESPPL